MPVMSKKAFALKRDVKVHFKRMHSEVRPFRCDDCNKMFAVQNDLKRHNPFILSSDHITVMCVICRSVT